MTTQIVYVLISRQTDYYTEQTMLSIYSLFKHNPDAKVTVVCDEETAEALNGNRHFKDLGKVEILAQAFPSEVSPKQRSRILKTTLRQLVRGDYLFIDSDTVICRNLSDIDKVAAPLALVYDINRQDVLNETDTHTIERCAKIDPNLNIQGHPFYNSGVILAKDLPEVHDFYRQWNENWLTFTQTGLHFDQPPFCVTAIKSGIAIHRLPDEWNCQFKYGTSTRNCRILHYFNPSNPADYEDSPFVFLIFKEIRKRGFASTYLQKFVDAPTTTLKTILEIQKESFGEMCASPLTEIWKDRNNLYLRAASITAYIFSKINKIR